MQLSPAKLKAYLAGEPFPIEIGDWIWMKHFAGVGGTVISTATFLKIPVYIIQTWDGTLSAIPMNEATLAGWG